MKVSILSSEKNPLLSRTEIKFEVTDSETTPSRKDLKKKIAALCNAKEEAMVIRKITQEYGSKNVSGEAMVYDSEQAMKEVELEHIMKRGTEKKKKEEAKTEEPAKEEKAAEEKKEAKEEKKTEEKKEKPKEEPEAEEKKE